MTTKERPSTLYLRDLNEVEPPVESYDAWDDEDIYQLVPHPRWAALQTEIWSPTGADHDPMLDKVRKQIKRSRNANRDDAGAPPEAAHDHHDDHPALHADTLDDDDVVIGGQLALKKRDPGAGLRAFLDHSFVEILLILLTLWALFAEDVRICALTRPDAEAGDLAVWIISFITTLAFAAELFLRSMVQRSYIFSFFFWLDVVAIGSMVPDFVGLFIEQSVEAGAGAGQSVDAARAGRVARAGTKVGRLLRLLRIVRVIKLVFTKRRKREAEPLDDEHKEYTPSELGKELKNRVAKTTIIFVLSLLLVDAILELLLLPNAERDFTRQVALTQLYLSSYAAFAASSATGMAAFYSQHLPAFSSLFSSRYGFFEQHLNTLVRVSIFDGDFYYTPHAADWPPLQTCDVPAAADVPSVPLSGPWCERVGGGAYGHAPDTAIPRLLEWQLNGTDDTSGCASDSCYPYAYPAVAGPLWYSAWWSLGDTQDAGVQSRPLPREAYPRPFASAKAYYPNCTLNVLFRTEESYRYCPWVAYHPRATELAVVQLFEDGTLVGGGSTTSSLSGFPPSNCTHDASCRVVAEAWYSNRPAIITEAGFSIVFTIIVCIILGAVGWILSRDADQLVIRPVERMVDSVTKLAHNPAYKLEAVKEVKYETDALYVSLMKISALLQVGFGEAGNNLVAENLRKGDTVDPMVPGKKLLGAYGFCIIDDYEEVLECLGEDILPFTNTAADIVHNAVTNHGGQPNRNLGEAFLCVWKPQLEGVSEPFSPAQVAAAETKMCDGALTAFRNSVRQVIGSLKLRRYNENDEIIRHFEGTYETRIGYGLHYGWAIEGAVGTHIKIDCSYLSPNVNLAARLESATKMYGVSILMSDAFVEKLSPAMRRGVRKVDVVCLKGSSIAMPIYTCDRSNAIYVSVEAVERLGQVNAVPEFQRTFAEALDAFVDGDWAAAKVGLVEALSICPRDLPCKRLMKHMNTPANEPDFGLANEPFVAPPGWPGFHALLSK